MNLSDIYFKVLLKEEDRLSAVISKIEEEAHVVPRSSFIQQPTGEVVKNRLFEGKIIAFYYLLYAVITIYLKKRFVHKRGSQIWKLLSF